MSLNGSYEPTPELAESYEISEDRLSYTFKLRQGVKFHNGKELQAEDVVASMNRWLTANTRAANLLPNAKFEELDPYTVKLTVEKATTDVLIILATRSQFAAIMPKDIVENSPAEGISEYIGTGPYVFKEWKPDQYIMLERYDGYQPYSDTLSTGFNGKKEAPTKTIYFYFVPDHATRIAGIRTGEYDIVESVPIENYEELSTVGVVALYTRSGGSLNAFLNTQQGILADVKYRQAVMTALNMDEIMLAAFADPNMYKLDGGYMNMLQTQWFVPGGKELYNQNNPEKAKELMAELGYNGEKITLLTTKDYQEMYAATLVVQEQLRRVGFNAEVINFDFPTFLETKGDLSKWDIFITSNGYNLTPPQILAVNPTWAGFNAPELPEMLAAIRQAENLDKAKEAWNTLQTFMYEYGSSTALGHYSSAMASTDKVENLTFFDQAVYWNVKVAK